MRIGKKVVAEKVEFYYDFEWNYRNLPKDKMIISLDALDYLSKAKVMSACRPILTEYFTEGTFILDYLFWFENGTLSEVDKKVQSNNYSDCDFENSIKTQYVNNLRCLKCNSTYNVLAVDPVLVYPGNFELGDKKLKKLRSKRGSLKCPKCGNHFTALVVHIF